MPSPRHFSLSLLLVLFFGLLLGCRATPPTRQDDSPPDAPSTAPDTSTDPDTSTSLQELFAPRTTLIVSFDRPRMDALSAQHPVLELLFQPLWGPDAPLSALQLSLAHHAAIGVDQDRPLYLGIGLHGQADALQAIQLGGPLDLQTYAPHLHLRTLIPADDATLLTERLRTHCDDQAQGPGSCEEYLSITIAGGDPRWVMVDQALNLRTLKWATDLNEELLRSGPNSLIDSTAWRAFESADAAVGTYLQLDDLFDFATLFALRDAPSGALSSLQSTAMHFFNNPELIEIADASFLLQSTDGHLHLDGFGTLTERGTLIADALLPAPDLHQDKATLPREALAIEWNFDLHEATAVGDLPAWAIGGVDEPTLKERADLIQDASAVLSLRAPVSTLGAYQHLFDDQTTPADVRAIEGFRLQLGLPDNDGGDVLSALSLRLQHVDDLESYQSFARSALIPFSLERFSRDHRTDQHIFLQTAGGAPLEELFPDEAPLANPGLRAHLNLPHLRGIQRRLDLEYQSSGLPDDLVEFITLLLPLTAYLDNTFQQIHLATNIDADQALFRAQFGAHLSPLPSPFANPAPAPTYEPLPACRQAVSLLATHYLLQSQPAEPLDLNAYARELRDIAPTCATPEMITILENHASAWETLLPPD